MRLGIILDTLIAVVISDPQASMVINARINLTLLCDRYPELWILLAQ